MYHINPKCLRILFLLLRIDILYVCVCIHLCALYCPVLMLLFVHSSQTLPCTSLTAPYLNLERRPCAKDHFDEFYMHIRILTLCFFGRSMPLPVFAVCPYLWSQYAPTCGRSMPLPVAAVCPYLWSRYAPTCGRSMPLPVAAVWPYLWSQYAPTCGRGMPLPVVAVCPYLWSQYAPTCGRGVPVAQTALPYLSTTTLAKCHFYSLSVISIFFRGYVLLSPA